MFQDYPDVMRVEEACEALRIGCNAMYELLNTKKIKAFKNGRVWRIPRESLIEYILTSSEIHKK